MWLYRGGFGEQIAKPVVFDRFLFFKQFKVVLEGNKLRKKGGCETYPFLKAKGIFI